MIFKGDIALSDYVGPKQRAILDALRFGVTLYQDRGLWYFSSGSEVLFQDAHRCLALYVRGFLMAEQDGGRIRYRLTEKGKQI